MKGSGHEQYQPTHQQVGGSPTHDLRGLFALISSGKVTVAELTDEELERIVMSGPGDLDIRQLSDVELEAIVKGDTTAW